MCCFPTQSLYTALVRSFKRTINLRFSHRKKTFCLSQPTDSGARLRSKLYNTFASITRSSLYARLDNAVSPNPAADGGRDLLLPKAISRSKREWLKGGLVVTGKFIADPSLGDEFIWSLEVGRVTICCPLVD